MAMIGFSLFFTLIAVGLLGYRVAFIIFFVLAALVAVLLIIRRARTSRAMLAMLLSAMIACAGFCAYTSLIYDRVTSYVGQNVDVTLEVTEVEGKSGDNYYYVTRIVSAPYKPLIGARVRLSSAAPVEAQVCDRISTYATLRNANYGNLKYNEIFLSARIVYSYDVEKNPDKSLRFYFYEIRQGISQLISANLDEESAAVVNSIFLGETSELDYRANMNFRNIGISHIFCVSGLHVSLISAAFYGVLSRALGRRKIVYLLTILTVWGFVGITGFSYSSIRAGVMLSVCYLGKIISRKSDSLNSLGLAAVVVCVLNPYSATNVAVLYSFFSTLGIILVTRTEFARKLLDRKSEIVRMIIETVLLSLGAMMLSLPVQIIFFDSATIISPLANLLVFIVIAPLMWCVIIAVVLSLFTSVLSELFFLICSLIAKYLIWIADLLSSIPYATVDVSMTFVKIMLFIVIAVLVIVNYLRLGRRGNVAAIISCSMIVVSAVLCYNIFYRPDVRVTVIDSGATSVVVTSGRTSVVVGCGGSKHTAGKIDTALRRSGIDEIDLLVLPSRDNSSSFNVSGLFEMTDVEQVVLGEEYGLIPALGVENYRVTEDSKFTVGDIEVACSYIEGCRATLVRVVNRLILIVSECSADININDEWLNADIIISVGEPCSDGNEAINILCTKHEVYYDDMMMCYKDSGNIEIELFDDGRISCERRA